MTNETLRMQMLSGIITEGEYKAKLKENKVATKKKPLKEHFIGMGAINSPFMEREKEVYEDAFEHFLSEKYEVKPNRKRDDIKDIKEEEKLDEVLQNDDLVYERMLDMDQEQLVSSILSFAENNPSTTLVDYLNNEFGYEPELEEGKEVEEPSNY
jgi:hypothetical protein